MNKPKFIERIKELIGHLGWRLFIWAAFEGDEERFHCERDKRAFEHWNVEVPKTLKNLYEDLP